MSRTLTKLIWLALFAVAPNSSAAGVIYSSDDLTTQQFITVRAQTDAGSSDNQGLVLNGTSRIRGIFDEGVSFKPLDSTIDIPEFTVQGSLILAEPYPIIGPSETISFSVTVNAISFRTSASPAEIEGTIPSNFYFNPSITTEDLDALSKLSISGSYVILDDQMSILHSGNYSDEISWSNQFQGYNITSSNEGETIEMSFGSQFRFRSEDTISVTNQVINGRDVSISISNVAFNLVEEFGEQPTLQIVPEPSTMLLTITFLGCTIFRRKRNSA